MLFNSFFKKPKTFWIIAIGIFLSYVIVGVGVYLWQSSIVKDAKKEQKAVVDQTLFQQNKMLEDAAFLQKDTQTQLEKIKNNQIDLNTVKIGDKLANGMTVKDITKEEEKTFVEFIGSVVVFGDFVYFNLRQSNDTSSAYYGKICMQVDEESFIKIPKLFDAEGISNQKQLCFSNTDVAKNRFGPPGNKGKATVAIDNFSLRIGDTYPYDEAELIKTIEIIK